MNEKQRLVALVRSHADGLGSRIASVFAVGGAVVPLEPGLPADRRATFLQLARPEFLLRTSVPVRLGGDRSRQPAGDGAFVYFTSGSTGVPKPVLGSAAALRSFVDWFCPRVWRRMP